MSEDLSLTNESHLAGVVRTDGDAKRRLYEGVVDQVSHVVECLPIVFTDTVREVAVRGPDSKTNSAISSAWCSTSKHSSPPVKIRLAEIHHEQRHRKRREDQQHLGEDGTIFLHLILGPTVLLRPCKQTHPWSFSNPSQRERTQSPHFENKLEQKQEKHVCLLVLNRQQMQHFKKRDRLALQDEIG